MIKKINKMFLMSQGAISILSLFVMLLVSMFALNSWSRVFGLCLVLHLTIGLYSHINLLECVWALRDALLMMEKKNNE